MPEEARAATGILPRNHAVSRLYTFNRFGGYDFAPLRLGLVYDKCFSDKNLEDLIFNLSRIQFLLVRGESPKHLADAR